MPVLRWPHDHHRDVRPRLHTQNPSAEPDHDRHIMMPLIRVRPPTAARSHRRSSTARTQTRLSAASAHALAYQSDGGARSKWFALPLRPHRRPPHLAPNSLGPAHRATTGNLTIPIARGTTERTRPAVSSPEASPTPAARVCRIVPHAAGVREPLTQADITHSNDFRVFFATSMKARSFGARDARFG